MIIVDHLYFNFRGNFILAVSAVKAKRAIIISPPIFDIQYTYTMHSKIEAQINIITRARLFKTNDVVS